MSGSAMVLVCALELMGRSASSFPPIHIVTLPPPGVSVNAQGFFDRFSGSIYLVSTAPSFRAAEAAQREYPFSRCPGRQDLKMVASVIVHEAWHARHGNDEREAYLAQLTELTRLGSGVGSPAYFSVVRAMRAALARSPRRAGTLAAR